MCQLFRGPPEIPQSNIDKKKKKNILQFVICELNNMLKCG